MPEKHTLFEELKNSKNNKFKQLNISWLDDIVDVVQTAAQNKPIVFCADHPILYFNREDAKEILQPILKNFYGLNLDDNLINKIFKHKASFIIDSKSKTDSTFFRTNYVKQELYKTAKKIVSYAQGNILLVVGQTPIYCAEMVKIINSTLDSQHKIEVICIPFSGRPDVVILDKPKHTWSKNYKNILNSSREIFYLELLCEKGFYPEKFLNTEKSVYILDYSSGPSLASFLLLISKWFKAKNIDLPDLNFISLAKLEDILIAKNGEWYRPGVNKPLNLKINQDLEFEIDIVYLNLENKIFRAFADLHDNLRVVPSFNALAWKEETMEIFEQYPRPQAKKLLVKYRNYALAQS